jgi:uncharacterized membrane protein
VVVVRLPSSSFIFVFFFFFFLFFLFLVLLSSLIVIRQNKKLTRSRTADHDIDDAANTQITIYSGRGLCKSYVPNYY